MDICRSLKHTLTHWTIIFMALFCLGTPTVKAQSTLWDLYHAYQGVKKAYKAFTITDEEIAESMAQAVEQMDEENEVCDADSRYAKRLRRITKGLTSIDGIELNFKVYVNKTEANAFASPDGSVRVYSKLMDIMSDDEVLGIIGHELGHLEGHHSLKEYKNALYLSAIREGLSLDDGIVGGLASSCIGALTECLLNAKYSRMQESEADDYGYNYLKKKGKNPYVMAQALSRLKTLNSGSSNKYARYVSELISSHPDLDSRVEKLTKRAKKEGYIQ